MAERLTLKTVRVRAVAVPLKRPVVSKVGLFREWPMLLIDLETHQGIVGRSYLEPYLKQSLRYVAAAIEDLGAAATGQPVAPFDAYRRGIGSLHLVGREGVVLAVLVQFCMSRRRRTAVRAGRVSRGRKRGRV